MYKRHTRPVTATVGNIVIRYYYIEYISARLHGYNYIHILYYTTRVGSQVGVKRRLCSKAASEYNLNNQPL